MALEQDSTKVTEPGLTKQALLAEIGLLRQKVAELENEKVDLELQLEINTAHSDSVTDELQDKAEELQDKVEETLRESAKRFRMIAEATPVPVVVSRVTDGKIVYANRLAGPLVGLPPEEILGRNTVEFYEDPQHRERMLEIFNQQGYINDYELQLRRVDGSSVWIAASIQYLTFNDEPCLLSALYDLTDRKRAEEERARLQAIQQELNLAQQIQASLLPAERPRWPNLDAVCHSVPARDVGGDFYAYHAFVTAPGAPHQSSPDLGPHRFAMAVGDVSGKGMPAALLMAVSFSSLQAIIDQGFSPGELMPYLDQALTSYTTNTRQNCALCYIDITPPTLALVGGEKGRIMRAANAGCVEPLIRRADGTTQWVEVGGMPLGSGLGKTLGYAEITLTLAAGDFVILSSDGVVEAMRPTGEIFGFERLEQAVARGPHSGAEAMLNHLKAEVENFVGETEPHDDLTIVVIGV